MSAVTFTSHEFDQDTVRAKKAAQSGPVFITDRGRPSYVLMTATEYERLTHPEASIVELLAMPDPTKIEFDPQHMRGPLSRPADLD